MKDTINQMCRNDAVSQENLVESMKKKEKNLMMND